MYGLPQGLRPEEILLYSRKSRSDDPLLSVEEVLAKHESMLNDWIERHFPGETIPERNRLREVVSGETIQSRPKLQQALKMIESPRYRALLCVDCERLSRGDTYEIGYLTRILRFSNTVFITLDWVYDLSIERDRNDFESQLKRGNSYLEYVKTIMQRGTENAVAGGAFVGSKAPYGYKKLQIKEGKRTIHTLTPDPDTAPVVRMIFEMVADGCGSYKIASKLNKMGIPSPSGRKWTASSIPPIRRNIHYIGKVRWNYRKEVKYIEDGEVVSSRPINKEGFSIFEGRHEAILDEELFWKVQEMTAKNTPVRENAAIVNPLAGLVYCRCGRVMSRRTYKTKDGITRSSTRLICDQQSECGTASCTLDEMMQIVIQTLRDAIADFDLKINSSQGDDAAMHKQAIARLEKRLEELSRLEISQWEKYSMDGMPKHIFEQLNAKVLQDKADVEKALEDARNLSQIEKTYHVQRATFQQALDALLDDEVDAKRKNQLLKECIERIDYHREKKKTDNRRYGTPEPIEVDIKLKV